MLCTLIVLFLVQPAFTKKIYKQKTFVMLIVLITVIDHELRHNWIEKRYL